MCDDDHDHNDAIGDPDHREDIDTGITRRHFSGLAVGAASAITFAKALWTPSRASAAPLTSSDGLFAYANAMHVHTSWSEGQASLHAQLSEAAANKVPVLWKTDHDWRELAHGAPDRISFTSLTTEQVYGKPLVWRATPSGSLSIGDGGIVASPTSPQDSSSTASALHVRAQSAAAAAASFRYYADFSGPRVSQRTNINGQTLHVDVYPDNADGVNGYLEVLVSLSYHPATGGRPAGRYQLSYRLGSAGGARSTQQLLGVVPVQVTLGGWQEVILDLTADTKALWPDLVAEDNSLFDLWLGASSAQTTLAEGTFDNLRFSRTNNQHDSILAAEGAVKSAYSQAYPQILLPRGREVSYYDKHLNAFGCDYIPDYTALPNVWANDPGWGFSSQMSAAIHAAGGLASFNHPFGTGAAIPSDPDSQAATLSSTFAQVYANAVCGADILEVGYQQRGSAVVNGKKVVADLKTHQQLWDMLSRNGFYLTANGVSDDHTAGAGQWRKNSNRFLTYTWAKSLSEADLLTSLASGRVYVGELASFSGMLDLWVDGIVPMGAVSIAPTFTSRTLTVTALGLPAGCAVRVLQGPIDYPGSGTTSSGAVAVATMSDTTFTNGAQSVVLDTSRSSYVRLDVVTSAGRTIAFSNPVYLLAEDSRRPVPTIRRAVDS